MLLLLFLSQDKGFNTSTQHTKPYRIQILIGKDSTAEFFLVNYPITLTNDLALS